MQLGQGGVGISVLGSTFSLNRRFSFLLVGSFLFFFFPSAVVTYFKLTEQTFFFGGGGGAARDSIKGNCQCLWLFIWYILLDLVQCILCLFRGHCKVTQPVACSAKVSANIRAREELTDPRSEVCDTPAVLNSIECHR